MSQYKITARDKTGKKQAKICRLQLTPPLVGGEARGPVDIVIWTIKNILGHTPCPASIIAMSAFPHKLDIQSLKFKFQKKKLFGHKQLKKITESKCAEKFGNYSVRLRNSRKLFLAKIWVYFGEVIFKMFQLITQTLESIYLAQPM